MGKFSIETINNSISRCRKCTSRSSKAILIGRKLRGDNRDFIDILFLGEAPKPDRYNNIQNRVIFGEYSPTGQRLRDFINSLEQKIPNITCWGTNCVKCDVTENYIGTAIINCRKYLIGELNILKPQVIIMLGSKVIENLVGEKLSIGKISKWNDYICVHSYHPMERTGRFIKFQDTLIKSTLNHLQKR